MRASTGFLWPCHGSTSSNVHRPWADDPVPKGIQVIHRDRDFGADLSPVGHPLLNRAKSSINAGEPWDAVRMMSAPVRPELQPCSSNVGIAHALCR